MNVLDVRVAKTAFYLQRLTAFPEIREAVSSGDKDTFAKICEKAKIPKSYIDRMLNLVFSVEAEQWPSWL